MPRTRSLANLLCTLSVTAGGLSAQTVAARLDAGDRDHRAGNAVAALAQYEAALALDSLNFDAAWRAAREAVDAGEFEADAAKREKLYARAERYARRALASRPADAEAHAQVARAVGRNALTKGTRDRIKYAAEVYEHARAALSANPRHGGALHILGVWNAEIMRLNSVSRLVAKTLLGGRVFGEASWENAQRYLEESMAVEPDRIVHRMDLAEVYVDRKATREARVQYQWIVAAPVVEPNDRHYKRQAEAALKGLK